MPIEVEVDGLGTLEFPDGTPDEVIHRTVRRETAPARKALLQDESRTARVQGAAIDALNTGIDVQTALMEGLTPQGLVGSAGKILNYAGDVAAGAAEDLIAGERTPTAIGNLPNPLGQRFSAAVMGEKLPRSAADTPLEQGVVDAARMVPTVAAGVGLAAAGLPTPAAFGGTMGASAFDAAQEAGASPAQAAVEGGVAALTGAVIPGVARAGSAGAARALGAAVERGLLSGDAVVAHKAAEALGGQVTVQAFMEGMNLPEYVAATPQQRRDMLIRNTVANTAFLAMDIPGVLSRGPSATQGELGGKTVASMRVAEVLDQAAKDPVAMEAIQTAVDDAVMDTVSGSGWARAWVPRDPAQEPAYRYDAEDAASPESAGVHATRPMASPGGELGAGPDTGSAGAAGHSDIIPAAEIPGNPADNPQFTAFPVELPEAVRLSRDLLGGAYPRVREQLGALKGQAAGVFKHNDAAKRAEIELRADIFDLVTRSEKAALRKQAEEYAAQVAEKGDDVGKIARDRFDYLVGQAYDQARLKNPTQAMKVVWHEIGHLVDWLPDHMISGRGNLFGRIASLKRYLRQTLPDDPNVPDRPITRMEKEKLRKQAETTLQQELGGLREVVETVMVEEPVFRTLKVTPEEVKGLFGLTARESTPELYTWFAAQDGVTKKEIVRKALRGVVDERAAALGKREKIGVRTVAQQVRRSQEGRAPTQAEIMGRFRDLLRKEMQARRLVELGQLKGELEPLIAWWRGTPKMEEYFRPSAEMYAEAFSAFMNNPAAVAKRAPTYYRMMQAYMERKPEVKGLYDEIQDQIRSGTVQKERVEELRASWRRDADESLGRIEERRQKPSFVDNVAYHIDRRFGPIYRAAKGTRGEAKLRKAIGDFTYRAAEHEFFLARMNERVGTLLMAHNLDWQDLGEYLFHQRIFNERFNLANPMGWTSKNSNERLQEMQRDLGPERWRNLVESGRRFRELYERQVIPLVKQARMWGDDLQKKIDDNVWYATFAAVKGIADSGIQRALDLSFGQGVSPHIYRQIGMLGEVKNPATGTVLKALSLMTAAHRNIAKREIVRTYTDNHPEHIAEARKRWTGKRWEYDEVTTPTVGTITFLEDGQPKSYYVPRIVADSINDGAPVPNQILSGWLKAQNSLKGAFTQLNYGFWPVNFVKDTLGFWLKMPGVLAPVGWLTRLPRAVAAARASVKGRSNLAADQALRRLMVSAREDPRGVRNDVVDEYELKVASYGLNPAQWDTELKGMRRAIGLWNQYREIGQGMERVNKIAGMLYLDEKFPDMPEWKKREIVRERAGSPNFLERGASPWADMLVLFYNAWKQDVRAVINAATDTPAAFATKAALGVGIPSALMAAASNGYLGDDLEEAYRSVPDRDMMNYFIVPLYWADKAQKKVAYLRMPLPDSLRILHGLTFKTLTGRGDAAGAFVWDQVPGSNPMYQVPLAWFGYMRGDNPTDGHTGRPILDETTRLAGGAKGAADMAKWTWNSLGGGLVHRFQNTSLETPPASDWEKFIRAPGMNNVVGRWIKVSNRGLVDADERVTEPVERQRAQVRLAVRAMVDRRVEAGVFDRLAESLPDAGSQPIIGKTTQHPPRQLSEREQAEMMARAEATPAELMLMRDPYALDYLMELFPDGIVNRSVPLMNRLDRAPSKASKAAILAEEAKRQQGR